MILHKSQIKDWIGINLVSIVKSEALGSTISSSSRTTTTKKRTKILLYPKQNIIVIYKLLN